MTVAVHLGGSVGFYSGNVQELLDDVLVSRWAAGLRCWATQHCSVFGTIIFLDSGVGCWYPTPQQELSCDVMLLRRPGTGQQHASMENSYKQCWRGIVVLGMPGHLQACLAGAQSHPLITN